MDTARYAALMTALEDARIARHRAPQMGRITAETTLAALIATLGERVANLPAPATPTTDGITTTAGRAPARSMPPAAMTPASMPPAAIASAIAPAMAPASMPPPAIAPAAIAPAIAPPAIAPAALPPTAQPGRAGDRLRTSRRPGRPHVGAMPVLDRFAPSPDLDDDAFDGETPEADAPPSDAPQPGAPPAHATPAHATPAHATPAHATPAHATPAHATPIAFDAEAFDDNPDAFGPISTSFAMPAAFEIDADAFDAEPDAFDVFDVHPLDRLDGSALDTGETSISTDDGLDTPNPHAALLRPPMPPSRPPAPAAPPPSPTRAAMHALFDQDDASGAGLVLFGDAMDDALDDGLDGAGDGASGFAPQPGTDPDMAPVPDEAEAEGLAEVTTDAALALLAEDDRDTSRPDRRRPTDEPVLAGAEAPVPMEASDAPFGFGFGDDEPTVATPRPQLAAPNREAPLREAPRDEPADPRGARRDETLLSSVRKLFGR